MNLTVEAENHGNPNLICTPPRWYDIIFFLSASYFAHVASVVLEPGTSTWGSVWRILFAFFIPSNGIARAVSTIERHAITEKNPLKQAARAGALCMAIKARARKIKIKKRRRFWFTGQDEEIGLQAQSSQNDFRAGPNRWGSSQ